jgi:hypothetical protein
VHEQHVIVLDAIQSFSGPELPANINRYFLRTVDMDVVSGKQTAFVMTKLGRFVFLGFIGAPPNRQWIGTKIRVNNGFIGAANVTLPKSFLDYLVHKAGRYATALRGLSAPQRRKIDEAAMAQLERVARSEAANAMAHDIRLFGAEAFEAHQGPEEEA